MKKIFTLSAFAFTILFFAQEAGKSGELLKNEASKTEMQKKRTDIASGSVNKNGSITSGNSGYRYPTGSGNRGNSNSSPTYNWNQNYGYSEVFLRIPERGYFTVEIGDQQISNASGKYRFFDLGAGRNPISIYENGYLIYRSQLNIRNNTRLVLDFFTREGLYLLDSYSVQNQTYGFNEWDDVWNNPYGNYNGNQNGGYNNGYYGNVLDNRSFVEFLRVLNRNSFDDAKVQFIAQQVRNNQFTSVQIKEILKSFSFDENKLEAAKMLYRSCVDKNNFFIVYDTFSFDSTRRKLMDYIARG